MFVIYGKPGCTFCDKAKEHLTELGLAFEYVDVSENDIARSFVVDTLQSRSVPQIIHRTEIGDFVVGGFDELVKYTRLIK